MPSPDFFIVKRSEPIPGPVFDTYWKFTAERQAMFHRRVRQGPHPWTDDPVLRQYKFTNPYRAADRVSQYLIREVIYAGEYDLRDTVLRTLIFKLFNKIETWELLQTVLGPICTATFEPATFARVLTNAMNEGATIYSAAYIMPSGPASVRRARKHEMHLALVDDLMRSGFADKLVACASMSEAYSALLALPGIGPFLAYQFVTDLNYSRFLAFSELEFVVPGPGARDGLRKCFVSLGDYSEADAIRWVTDRQHLELERRGLAFESLWGRPLQLIDCQNLFCEVDKYARVVHPDVAGFTGRTRIKQKYSPHESTLARPWFPPKWGLNDRIADSRHTRRGCRSEIESQHSAEATHLGVP
jgi:alpha-glutamyl/putrescinyl thymine pyrophosphorylase clade 1